jgi:apolipoprotein N-acyltransferase
MTKRALPWLIAGTSGIIYFAAYPGVLGAWPLIFVTLIPLMWGTQDVSPLQGALLGWTAGIVSHVLGFLWLFSALQRFTSTTVALVAFAGLSLYQGGRLGLAAGIARFLASRGHATMIAWPIGVALSEILYPMVLPFTMAATLYPVPTTIQTADLGGAPLVVFQIVFVNATLLEILAARTRRRTIFALSLSALVCLAYSLLRTSQVLSRVAEAERARVALIQPSAAATQKRGNPDALTRQFVESSRQLIARDQADFLIWGETAVAMPADARILEWVLRRRFGAPITVPVVLGVVISEHNDDTEKLFNSAVALDSNGKLCTQCRYDKHRLLPIGEYIPFALSPSTVDRWLHSAANFEPGSSTAALMIGTHHVTAIICNEVLSAEYVRRQVNIESEAIINLSSAAWFDSPAAGGIQLAQAQLRAIENRRFLMMASTDGLGGVIGPTGEVEPANGSTTMTANIAWLRGWTLYSFLGDWPLLGVGALLLLWRRQGSALVGGLPG